MTPSSSVQRAAMTGYRNRGRAVIGHAGRRRCPRVVGGVGTAAHAQAFCTSRLSSRATATALERRRPDSAGPGRRRVRRVVLAIVRASLLRENWLLLAAFCWLRVFCVFSPRRSARSTTGLESSGYRHPTSSHVCQTSLPMRQTRASRSCRVLPTVG